MSLLAPELSDDAFVDSCYRLFLDRLPDEAGKRGNLQALSHGASRLDIIASLTSSKEYYHRLMRTVFGEAELADLRLLRPSQYESAPLLRSEQTTQAFRVDHSEDYDWLEKMILEHGYYDKPGVWSLSIDQDKHVIAEIAGSFRPKHCLELGCSTGPVLKLLTDGGIDAEGVEISHLALAYAYPEVKRKIHFGDLLGLPLDSKYDLVVGMDVFEHLNPNKLSRYLSRCYDLLVEGGILFTNIPAFGRDVVFGEVFPVYLERWQDKDGADADQFSFLPVDETGWPINGHLIWAKTEWWQRKFEEPGFVRETTIERTIHKKYDAFYDSAAPARKSLFVFSKQASPSRIKSLAEFIMTDLSLSA